MQRDPLWQKIHAALSGRLDPTVFERCAQDLLKDIYPGLVPVVGGSDAGMDGAIPSDDGVLPLVCTTGEDVLGNFRKSISNHLEKRGGPARCVMATSQALSPQRRDNVFAAAKELGVTVHQIHEREDFVGRLYIHAAWRRELLGITGKPSPLSIFPPVVRQLEASLVIGREDDLRWIRSINSDALIVGQPGSGKTHLHQHMTGSGEAAFAVSDDAEHLADAIREQQPQIIVIDDAHISLERLDLLRRLRLEVGANFKIHANCWPNFETITRDRMGISISQTRQLNLIPRKQMHELICALGIFGPDQLMFLLLAQAAGRPGLAAALVEACNRGEVNRVWNGDALAEKLLVLGRTLRDETDRELLARFALGGDYGATVDTVADAMKMRHAELRERVTMLGTGGIIAELGERELVVHPDRLRAVLVRDVFFSGPTRPSLEPALAACPNAVSMTHVLISAAQREARVSRHFLREQVARLSSNELWTHYAYLDREAAEEVLKQSPEVVCAAGEGLLRQLPTEAVAALLRTDRNATEPTHQAHGQSRLLTEWISDWDEEEETAPRRQLLLDCLKSVQNSAEPCDDAILLKYSKIVLDPRLHGSRTRPEDRNSVSIRRGVHSEQNLRLIAELWPQVSNLLPKTISPAWNSFIEGIRDWAWPARCAENADSTLRDVMQAAAKQFVADLAQLPQSGRGLRCVLRHLSDDAGMDLQIEADQLFDTVFRAPDRSPDWEKARAERDAELAAVADTLLLSGRAEAVKQLGMLERDAEEVGITREGWDRGILYGAIAQGVPDAICWLSGLIGEKVQERLLIPFVNQARQQSPAALSTLMLSLVDHQLYSHLATAEVLRDPTVAIDVIASVIDGLDASKSANAGDWSFGLISVDRLLLLLRHRHFEIRRSAAIGEWYSSQEKVRSELCDDWKEIILSSDDRHDGELCAILAKNRNLAFEWIERRLKLEHWRFSGFGPTFAQLSENLTDEERIQLGLILNTPSNFDEDILFSLIGNDEARFRKWLSEISDNHVRAMSLRQPPSEWWAERAIFAMDLGVPVDTLLDQINARHSWDEPASAYFQKCADGYKTLSNHRDHRLQTIGRRGLEWANARVALAKQEEFLKSVQ